MTLTFLFFFVLGSFKVIIVFWNVNGNRKARKFHTFKVISMSPSDVHLRTEPILPNIFCSISHSFRDFQMSELKWLNRYKFVYLYCAILSTSKPKIYPLPDWSYAFEVMKREGDVRMWAMLKSHGKNFASSRTISSYSKSYVGMWFDEAKWRLSFSANEFFSLESLVNL